MMEGWLPTVEASRLGQRAKVVGEALLTPPDRENVATKANREKTTRKLYLYLNRKESKAGKNWLRTKVIADYKRKLLPTMDESHC